MTNPAEQHGSDITQYPRVDTPGTTQRVLEGTPVVGGLAGAISAVAGGVQGLAMEALFALRDPIYALAEAGLTIVLELVDPFNDVLEMVSGDHFEQAYTDGCDEMAAAITGIEDALNGDAVKLRDSATDYRTADDEAAAALNRLLSEFED